MCSARVSAAPLGFNAFARRGAAAFARSNRRMPLERAFSFGKNNEAHDELRHPGDVMTQRETMVLQRLKMIGLTVLSIGPVACGGGGPSDSSTQRGVLLEAVNTEQ
ncbi:MAG: hypothetical protein EKK52_20665 [Burkholderiales bacterium]|uniref:hypothetical protein n=1 Tax=Roseateles sp. TaxID=1971397 RepID=UPI000FA4D6C4|nr:MAG: hypothetical protein EKK52_20665 [Burkholderiales bacterium]